MEKLFILGLMMLGWLVSPAQLRALNSFPNTTPKYGLEKVQRLIRQADSIRMLEADRKREAQRKKDSANGIMPDSEDYTGGFTRWTPAALSDTAYFSLSLRERFTYNMINPETYMQTCGMRWGTTEKGKIRARLPEPFGEYQWTVRQDRFFKLNRDSVMAYIREGMSERGVLGLNEKMVLMNINAYEMIPWLIGIYNPEKGDPDILTLLTQMMTRASYEPFCRSAIYHELHNGKTSSYSATLTLDTAVEGEIIRMADEFYKSRKTRFVLVPAGTYWVGKKGHMVNPLRSVRIDSIYIASCETTNREFADFVYATGYVTDAESRHDALVFVPGLDEFRWLEDSTASWRYPNGISRGGIGGKMDHPVTSISYRDILAYCKWAGVRLPTLEEWEIAARAGSRTDWFFGSDDSAIGRYANVWHGADHLTADSSDGYMYTSPVGSFAPNPWGLYDVYGNVFEFCTGKLDPQESPSLAHARGGSWWCSARSCHYFNSCDIGSVNVHASFSNQGFRVVKENVRR